MSHSHSEPPVPSTPAGQTPESPRRPSPRRRLLTGISVVAILTLLGLLLLFSKLAIRISGGG